MWILDQLIRSDRDLKGPSLQTAPWLGLQFYGSRLRFKDPVASAMFPPKAPTTHADLSGLELSRDSDGGLAALFYSKGWAFKGKNRRGGVDATCRILSNARTEIMKVNFFERTDLADEMLRFCHNVWGWQNDSRQLGDLGSGLFSYPTHQDQLQYMKHNNLSWCFLAAAVRGEPPRQVYSLPLTAHHILVVDFEFRAYMQWDFYSPDSNLEEATHKFVEEFMNNFHVELSDEAKAQRAAAKDPI